jgi:hypothetical protein
MVRNLVNTTSEDFSNAAWDKVLCTVTAGFADPDGGTGAYRLQSTGVGGYLEQVIATTKMPIANAAVMSWYVKSNTGASQTVKSARFAGIESKTVTTSWQRLEHFTASAGGSNFYLQDNGGNNLDILIYKCQIEDVTGQADQTASEYEVGLVSVGARRRRRWRQVFQHRPDGCCHTCCYEPRLSGRGREDESVFAESEF